MLVVCHNSPSALKLRRAWIQGNLNTKIAVDFIALPCGVEQMSRAVTYLRKLYIDLHSRSADLQSHNASEATQPPTGKIVSHDVRSQDQSCQQSFKSHSSAFEEQNTIPMELGPFLSETGHALSTSDWFPHTANTLTHLTRSNPITLQGIVDDPSSVQPSMTNLTISSTAPTADGPVLLLVDDNRINLQLLVAFAKRKEYPYVAVLDGKLALDAFEASHRYSLASSGSGEATAGSVGTGPPTVILMDINMPVMDGYEAVQRIRAYEGKHQTTPVRIIAVTALQSEAAQMEAFGSGFDMFLSKPIKLKSLAKLIQDVQAGYDK